jgi:Ca2+-binding EF-hand superfamily protein
MKARFLLSLWSINLVCCLAADADTKPETAIFEDVQDIVFFGETRPVLIRLHIPHDGKSYQAVWEDFLQTLFAYLDTNRDGVLSTEEAARTPPTQVLVSGSFLTPGQFYAASSFEQPEANKDGKVTLEELRQFYRRSGASFQIQVRPGRARAPVQPGFGRNFNQPPNAVALNAMLYKLLDADQDGQLSREELAAAQERLLPRDANDDETVASQELVLGPDPVGFRMVQSPQPAAGGEDPNPTFLALTPGESATRVGEVLLTRYGGATPDRKLTRQKSGLDEATFSQLDKSADGGLDSEELAAFIHREPDLDLTYDLRIATRPEGRSIAKVVGAPAARLDGRGGPVVQLRLGSRPTPLSPHLLATPEGAVVLDLGGTSKLDLRAGDGDSQPVRTPEEARERYKVRFEGADEDKNGYLDANEASSVPAIEALFKLMDLDGDGKLTEKELLAYFDQMQELRTKVANGCASLSVVDQGGGLFDLVDANGDGRLSVREMRLARFALEKLDRNRDGFFNKDEIPHSYVATFARRPLDTTPAFGGMFINNGPAPPPTQSAPVTGPLWFRKLDRNQDGDVSRREFIGLDQQFTQMDTDGDGLLTSDEADRADAQFRTQQDSRR